MNLTPYYYYNHRFPDGYRPAHCDMAVVHRPGTCCHCDDFAPGLQTLREFQRVNFTGETDQDKAPCPAEFFRPVDDINLWQGNRPMTETSLRALNDQMEDIAKRLSGEECSEVTTQPPAYNECLASTVPKDLVVSATASFRSSLAAYFGYGRHA